VAPTPVISVETTSERREIGQSGPSGTLHPRSAAGSPAGTRAKAIGERRGNRNLWIGTMSDIVIYEENDLMRALLEEWLSEAGYRVRAAAPREAQQGPADLVIVSVYMPKRVGAQVVREMQAAHPGAPLIAISGLFRSGLWADGAAARTLGVQQVIAKPLTRSDLLDAVRAMIGAPN
jgi:CheY-like chemotaxis protein